MRHTVVDVIAGLLASTYPLRAYQRPPKDRTVQGLVSNLHSTGCDVYSCMFSNQFTFVSFVVVRSV